MRSEDLEGQNKLLIKQKKSDQETERNYFTLNKEELKNLYNPGLKNRVITIPVHPSILIKLIF